MGIVFEAQFPSPPQKKGWLPLVLLQNNPKASFQTEPSNGQNIWTAAAEPRRTKRNIATPGLQQGANQLKAHENGHNKPYHKMANCCKVKPSKPRENCLAYGCGSKIRTPSEHPNPHCAPTPKRDPIGVDPRPYLGPPVERLE